MAMSEKVVSFGIGEVYQQIERFLDNKGYSSTNTGDTYRRGIKKFFEIVKQKRLEFLNKDDVQIEFEDFEDFVKYLSTNTELNNKTINNYVSSVAELLRYLHVKKINNEIIVKDISCLASLKMVRLPENDNEYGVLTVEEVFDFANWSKENEKELEDIKYYFILFSLDTCIRKGAALNLKWDDLVVNEDHVLVKAIEKGNKDFRGKISLDFYNEILKLKEKYNSEKVFNISSSTLQLTLNRWKKARNIIENRNIVIHSVRKAGGTYHFRVTGDILQAKKILGHSNVSTTQKYLGTEDYGVVGVVSTGGNIDQDLYKNVDKETLIKAIENIKGYKTLINVELNKLLSEKSD